MKKTIFAGVAAAALCGLLAYQNPAAPVERDLIAIERASMDGWLKGDSAPMLSAADPDITLFHIMTLQRADGVDAVKALYKSYDGRPLFDSYQIDNPKVQAGGDMAVLTYQLVAQNGPMTRRYNVTEVFRKKAGAWRIVHSHFSATAGSTQ